MDKNGNTDGEMDKESHKEVDTSALPVKLRRLSKLLSETLTRLETVEGLQAVTVDEQEYVSSRLADLAERVRMIVARRCTCMTSPTKGSEDVFSNSTASEEYRPR
jgi:hypothetical protein